jgi:hypothetical protein
MGADMMRLADEQVGSWPVQQPVDLLAYAKKLVRTFAIGLLFGDDRAHGYPIADLINQGTDHNWSWKIFAFPVKVPGTPFYEMLRKAEMNAASWNGRNTNVEGSMAATCCPSWSTALTRMAIR